MVKLTTLVPVFRQLMLVSWMKMKTTVYLMHFGLTELILHSTLLIRISENQRYVKLYSWL